MGVIPDNRVGKIEFYEAHLSPWTTNAAAIGLTPAAVTALSTATSSARKAYNDHLAAQAAAKAATTAFYDKVRIMHAGPGGGADMIQTIKTYAQTTNNPNVYVLSQIPPPSQGGVTPPPGTSFDFAVGLLQDRSLELKWKCSNPSGTVGTIYEVKRQIGPPTGAMTFVGATGVKTFTDDSLPANASPCTYQITAVRSTARGNPAQFTVNFGMGGGGGFAITSITDTSAGTNVKLAA